MFYKTIKPIKRKKHKDKKKLLFLIIINRPLKTAQSTERYNCEYAYLIGPCKEQKYCAKGIHSQQPIRFTVVQATDWF